MYAVALILFTAYVLLDTFVIPRSYAAVQDGTIQAETSGEDEEITVSASGASRAENSADGSETSDASDTGKLSSAAETVTATDTSYQNSGVSITMTTTRYEDTTVYVADITLSSAEALKTALAKDTYGKNLTEKTSVMAEEHSAVLAVNGDYYGAQNRGYVIRNGTLYRDTAASSDQEDLVIGSDGSFSIIK